jgi:hypothetical protein
MEVLDPLWTVYSGVDAPKGSLCLCIKDLFTATEGDGLPNSLSISLVVYAFFKKFCTFIT